jgi:hypothetical protein
MAIRNQRGSRGNRSSPELTTNVGGIYENPLCNPRGLVAVRSQKEGGRERGVGGVYRRVWLVRGARDAKESEIGASR